MPKAKKPSEHKLHATIISFSVIAGLALAACQPQMMKQSAPTPTPTQEQQVLQTSPAPTENPAMQYEGPTTTPDSAAMDKEVDSALMKMDSSIKTTNPNEVSGSDLQ